MKMILRLLFFQFVDRKIMGLELKYYLLPGDASQVSIFFSLHMIKMSEQHRLFIL